MNLSEVSKFQVLTCLFGVCLIIGIAVVDHTQNSKLKTISKSYGFLLKDSLNTKVSGLTKTSSAKDITEVGAHIQMVKHVLLTDEDFKEFKGEMEKFDEKMTERITQLAKDIEDAKSSNLNKEEKLEEFKTILTTIKKYANKDHDYKDVEKKLQEYENKKSK